jgi:outer membrane lipase/esterase
MKNLFAILFLVLLGPTFAAAGPITSLYVVGDSLSDQGNAFALTGGFPPPPYVQRASNGPVAAERMANVLGVTLASSMQGGTNYAVVGATTGPVLIPSSSATTENLAAIQYGQPALAGTGLVSQVLDIVQAGPIADPDGALFMVWGGANDLFLNPSATTAANAVGHLGAGMTELYGLGARHFLVPNLPDLSNTPAGRALPQLQRAGLQALTIGFNNLLASQLDLLSLLPGIDITRFDAFAFFNAILANPGVFGFSNVSDPCVTGNLLVGGSICADPSSYVFWDTVHPTTAAHQVLGDHLAAATVPEPATLTLLSLGVGLALAARRRR